MAVRMWGDYPEARPHKPTAFSETYLQEIQRENLRPHDVLEELTAERGLGSRHPRPACPGSTISAYAAIHRGARNPKRCRLFENEDRDVDICDVPSDDSEDDAPPSVEHTATEEEQRTQQADVDADDETSYHHDVPSLVTLTLALNGRFGHIRRDPAGVIEDDDVDEKTVQLSDAGAAEAQRVHNTQRLARKLLIRNVCPVLRDGWKTFASQKRCQCCSPGCKAWRSFGSNNPCPFEDRHEEMARDYFMALEQEDEGLDGFAEPSIQRGPVRTPKVRSGKRQKTSTEDPEPQRDDLACGSHSCAHRPDVIGAEKPTTYSNLNLSNTQAPVPTETQREVIDLTDSDSDGEEEEIEPAVPPSPYPQLNLLDKRSGGTYSLVFGNGASKQTRDTGANAKRSDGTYSLVFGNVASKQTRDTGANAKRSDGTYSLVFGNGASKQTRDTGANAKRTDGMYSMVF